MRCQRNDVFISHGNRHVDFPSHQPEQEETAKTSAHLAKLADSADNVADLCIEIHAQLFVESFYVSRFRMTDPADKLIMHQQYAGHYVIHIFLFYIYFVMRQRYTFRKQFTTDIVDILF